MIFIKLKSDIILTVLLALIVVFSANAQPLDTLIAEAMSNNSKLKSLKLKETSAKYKAEGSSFLPAPTLGLEFSQTPINQYDILNESISNNLSFSQMFMLGGKLSAMKDASLKESEVAVMNSAEYRVALANEIRMTYFSIWALQKEVELRQKLVVTEGEIKEFLQIELQRGGRSQADFLSINNAIIAEEVKVFGLQRKTEAVMAKMNQLLGRGKDAQNITLPSALPVDEVNHHSVNLEAIIAEKHPSFKKMDIMTDMARLMITANKKELYPDIMAQVMIMRMPQGMILTAKNSMMMYEGKDDYMFSLMASVTLPFMPWSRGKYDNKEMELLADIDAISEEKKNMLAEMSAMGVESIKKMETAKESIKRYTLEIMPNYKSILDLQTESFKTSKIDVTSLLETYKMKLMDEIMLNMFIADYNMAKAELEMTKGTVLQ